MPASGYEVGDTVRFSCAFTNAAGAAADPTAVAFKLRYKRTGDSTAATYTAGASTGDHTIVKDSTGNYHADVTITGSGDLYWRWEATGAVTAAAQGKIAEIAAAYA